MNRLIDSNIPGYELNFFERLRYYFGKLLAVRDYHAEQSYFNEKRWLLNRHTIGWGVVCGLKVKAVQNDPNMVVVEPGLALDRYGNEIFVGKETNYNLSAELSTTPQPTPPPESKTCYLAIRYKECLAEPVSGPQQPCSQNGSECYYGRIYELFELRCFDEKPLPSAAEPTMSYADMFIERCQDFIHPCPSRSKYEWLILASITLDSAGVIHIDNRSDRKWLWSNEALAACLSDTMLKTGTERIDRRQFVPLLAQTIKGVRYCDGRILTITDYWPNDAVGRKKLDIGIEPHDITTDGDYIWFTDRSTANTSETVLKINREGTVVTKFKIPFNSRGIAYDGCFMWITHQTPGVYEGSVYKISKTALENDKFEPIPIMQSNPTEIVSAGNYMWIACDNGIQKINICTNELDFVQIGFTPISLAFDGQFIWFLYLDVKNQGYLNKIDLENHVALLQSSIFIGQDAKYLSFDGTHLWVTHSKGISRINIIENQLERTADADNCLTGVAFDGSYVWVAEPASGRIDRIDIYSSEQTSELRLSEGLELPCHFCKMCFDGTFMWVTDYVGEGAEQKGVIHRLLV